MAFLRSLVHLASVTAALGTAAQVVKPLRAQCSSLLQGVVASKLSDVEVSAYCRAAYPLEMCKAMRDDLGSMPWSTGRMEKACAGWQTHAISRMASLPPKRRAMQYEELQAKLDASAKQKEAAGYDLPKNPDGSVDLDKAAQKKLEQSNSMKEAYKQYFGTEGNLSSTQEAAALGASGLASRAIPELDFPPPAEAAEADASIGEVSGEATDNVAAGAVGAAANPTGEAGEAEADAAANADGEAGWAAADAAGEARETLAGGPAVDAAGEATQVTGVEMLGGDFNQGQPQRLYQERSISTLTLDLAAGTLIGFGLIIIAVVGFSSRLIFDRSRREWTPLPDSEVGVYASDD